MSDIKGYINVSGGIFTTHFVNQMCEETAPSSIQYLKASDYQLSWNPDSKFTESVFKAYIAEQWDELLLRWNTYGIDLDKMDLTTARRVWIRPILEALGFELVYTPKWTELSAGITFPLSHKGWFPGPGYPIPPIVHIIQPSTDIDEKTDVKGIRSAHAAVQMYLNNHDERWSIVTNGKKIRILRDFFHTSIQGYIEFDLSAIFYFRKYSDFVALFRFCHASRFVVDKDGNCPLDLFFEQSKTVGETIGKDLQQNVRRAIEELGNGFITENKDLFQELLQDPNKCKILYSDLLKIIYRIIFMLYAEQRGLLVTDKCDSLFLSEYSITSLRKRVADISVVDDNYTDLWEGLTVTFSMLKDGVEELGVPAFNGMLFDNSDGVILKGRKCRNSGVIKAIQYLTTTEGKNSKFKTKVKQSISYGDISVEEIGGIYEGLLEYVPMVSTKPLDIDGVPYPANSFILNPMGMDRKKTGSYYTNPGLIDSLIKSALNPVIDDKLKNAGNDPKEQEKALLSIRVCDPACGSGAFLIAATNRLGFKLAQIRAKSEIPTDAETREACRDVLSQCIYGVDINPMSVELAKVSLWINALVKGKPLNFLDNHIQCGNSLIGATRELMADGIPDSAFTRTDKAEKTEASKIIKKNQKEHLNASLSAFMPHEDLIARCIPEFEKLSASNDDSVDAVHKKEETFRKLTGNANYRKEKLACDLWCSAFFWNLKDTNRLQDVPTQGVFSSLYKDGIIPSSEIVNKVEAFAEKYQFFHWHLAFPDIFSDENGGFDCILGNPPWERIKIQEKEFFSTKDEKIANAENAAKRQKMINGLRNSNPKLHEEFEQALLDSEKTSLFIRESGKYPLTGTGDINTYTVFSELAKSLVNPEGFAGIIVPSGICTDSTTSKFFSDLVDSKRLSSIYDFENSKGLFPIHRSFKFCLFTISGIKKPIDEFNLAFFLHTPDEILDPDKVFTLMPKDLKLINPNTGNCPIFRSRRDAEITKKIYQKIPVLWNENTGENPWNVSFQSMFHMSNDSNLFETYSSLIAKGCKLEGNIFVKGDEKWLPLYEAKMFWYFDHRFGTYDDFESRSGSAIISLSNEQKMNADKLITPYYWIAELEVNSRLKALKSWIIAFRKITNATNERTSILAALPPVGLGDSATIINIETTICLQCCFLANLSSIIFDYVARQKVGGLNFNFYIMNQLPVISPSSYTEKIIELIVPKVVELTYTAHDLDDFAKDVLKEIGAEKWNSFFPQNPVINGTLKPFIWDEDRRYMLQRELDAIYAHLYGLTESEIDYILDTFTILMKKEMAIFGEYLSKKTILKYYEEYERIFEYSS